MYFTVFLYVLEHVLNCEGNVLVCSCYIDILDLSWDWMLTFIGWIKFQIKIKSSIEVIFLPWNGIQRVTKNSVVMHLKMIHPQAHKHLCPPEKKKLLSPWKNVWMSDKSWEPELSLSHSLIHSLLTCWTTFVFMCKLKNEYL